MHYFHCLTEIHSRSGAKNVPTVIYYAKINPITNQINILCTHFRPQ